MADFIGTLNVDVAIVGNRFHTHANAGGRKAFQFFEG
jgi:hypothetical protein